jgi:hypothetical protein
MKNYKRLISFPSIEQFRTIVTNINRHFNFVGLDENGDAIYDVSKPKPTLTFKGTVKLHGTNFGVCFNAIDGMWCQSRENIITPTNDNAGSAFFAESHKAAMLRLFAEVAAREGIDTSANTISIYFEWVGKGIQKNVAISQIDKSAFIIGVKVTPHIENEEDRKDNPAYWVSSEGLSSVEDRIYNIEDFETFSIDVDFNVPQLSQNAIIEMTMAVEASCPVGKAFGIDDIGEGIVFSCEYKGQVYRFKSKGTLHAGKSKVTTLKPVDNEKIQHIINVAQLICPDWRLDQMLTQTFDLLNGGELDVKKLGDYIKAVTSDVFKEEMLTLADNGVEPKEVGKYVSEIAKKYFFEQYQLVG